MNTLKDKYLVKFNCPVNLVEQHMQNYLKTNGFTPYEKNGEKYFRSGDSTKGYKGLTYEIVDNTITVFAWMDSTPENYSLKQNRFNTVPLDFKNSLNNLMLGIAKLNGDGNIINDGDDKKEVVTRVVKPIYKNISEQSGDGDVEQFYPPYENKKMRKKEIMCIGSFWIALLGLICSFTGNILFIAFYVFDFFFAIQGLETRKRGIAIASIVLLIISVLISVLYNVR